MSAHREISIGWRSSSHNPDGPMIGDSSMITNADEGAVLAFEATHASADWSDWQPHLATISGSSASVSMPGGGFHTVTPLLQLEDGSFAGTASAGSYDPWAANQMIAFDSTGAIRWSAPGYTPKIATADGGVLAADSSGSAALFDENGVSTGMRAAPTYSWTTEWYTSSGGQVSQIELPTTKWATSYSAAAGGNPSGNGTAVGVTESNEGLPVFGLRSWGPGCVLRGDASDVKVTLTGSPLSTYNAKKQALKDGNYLTSSACTSFFNATPARAAYTSALTSAVDRQLPFDGLQTTISQYAAGMISVADLSNAAVVKIRRSIPVCGTFVSFRNWIGSVKVKKDNVTAAAQIYAGGQDPTDVYVNTDTTNRLTQATILHEALHNLTGMYDDDLKALLGLTGCLNVRGSICISNALRDNGCAGPD